MEEHQEPSQNSEELNCDRFSAHCGNDGGDGPPMSSRKSLVRFSKQQPQVQTIVSREDYSASEVNACWYSPEEKSTMYEGYEKMVMRMEQGKRPKKNTTYRGLENFSETNSAQLDEIVHACIDAVMDEQDRQWQEDVFDWNNFREISLEVSEQSAFLAYKMAEYDEREARKAYIAMAKEEYERKQRAENDADASIRTSYASISTEVTEATTSTMVQDIKKKHHKTSASILGRKKKSKKKKSRPPKARSSGSRKLLGDALDSLNKKSSKKVYNKDKLRDREFQSKIMRTG